MLRCSEHKLYQRLMPFVMGVIIGEFAVGNFWGLVGSIGGFATCRFWAY